MKTYKKEDDYSDIDKDEAIEFIASGKAAIYRVAGKGSQYVRETKNPLKTSCWKQIPTIGGVLKALRRAIASGYLESLEEIINADLFSDFLEMADYLLKEGYKDAAAVMIGGVLEEHLRKLCLRNKISIEWKNKKGKTQPKKASTMNDDLKKEMVYSKLEQKQVATWLDLRNNAAHGNYDKYDKKDVDLFLQGARNFLSKFLA